MRTGAGGSWADNPQPKNVSKRGVLSLGSWRCPPARQAGADQRGRCTEGREQRQGRELGLRHEGTEETPGGEAVPGLEAWGLGQVPWLWAQIFFLICNCPHSCPAHQTPARTPLFLAGAPGCGLCWGRGWGAAGPPRGPSSMQHRPCFLLGAPGAEASPPRSPGAHSRYTEPGTFLSTNPIPRLQGATSGGKGASRGGTSC